MHFSENCVFCQIVNRNEKLIFENESVCVFLDKFRRSRAGGICLVVPKRHVENIFELPEECAEDLMKGIRTVSIAVKKGYGCKGVRIWSANGKSAGQSVFHLHFHIVPCNSIWDRLRSILPGAFDLLHMKRRLSDSELERWSKLMINELTLQSVKT